MKHAHTPGPWFTAYPRTTRVFGNNTIICDCAQTAEMGDLDADRADANARLIAEAPALAELAEAFLAYLMDDSRSDRRRAECIAACKQSLARAKGQP